jgi:hypothetical protein
MVDAGSKHLCSICRLSVVTPEYYRHIVAGMNLTEQIRAVLGSFGH